MKSFRASILNADHQKHHVWTVGGFNGEGMYHDIHSGGGKNQRAINKNDNFQTDPLLYLSRP